MCSLCRDHIPSPLESLIQAVNLSFNNIYLQASETLIDRLINFRIYLGVGAGSIAPYLMDLAEIQAPLSGNL